VEIDNKLNKYLKITGLIYNVFRPQKRNCGRNNITPVLVRIQDYRRNWLQHIKRMPHIRLPRILRKL
jgi:hypothetical protein